MTPSRRSTSPSTRDRSSRSPRVRPTDGVADAPTYEPVRELPQVAPAVRMALAAGAPARPPSIQDREEAEAWGESAHDDAPPPDLPQEAAPPSSDGPPGDPYPDERATEPRLPVVAPVRSGPHAPRPLAAVVSAGSRPRRRPPRRRGNHRRLRAARRIRPCGGRRDRPRGRRLRRDSPREAAPPAAPPPAPMEIRPEDVVSVEMVPSDPATAAPSPGPMRPRLASIPGTPPGPAPPAKASKPGAPGHVDGDGEDPRHGRGAGPVPPEAAADDVPHGDGEDRHRPRARPPAAQAAPDAHRPAGKPARAAADERGRSRVAQARAPVVGGPLQRRLHPHDGRRSPTRRFTPRRSISSRRASAWPRGPWCWTSRAAPAATPSS